MISQYTPEKLSPLPVTPAACALPYGVTWEDLQGVLPKFSLHRQNSAQAFCSYQKQGLNGGENSMILTLRYPDEAGQENTQTIFLKSIANPRLFEGYKYRFLEAHGAPTPRLLAALRKGDAEVIVLEFLAKIGIDFNATPEIDDLLRLAARINTLPLPKFRLTTYAPQPQDAFDQTVHRALDRLAARPGEPGFDPSVWFSVYLKVQKIVKSMPRVVNHNQFTFQQVGWAQRGSGHALVVFDLETLSLTPRFSDIAGILQPIALYSGQTQEELFQSYLAYLQQFSGTEINFNEALTEMRLLRINDHFDSLSWLLDWEAESQGLDAAESLSLATTSLWADLKTLGLA